MRLYVDVKTNIPDLCLDNLIVQLNSGKEVCLTWDGGCSVMDSEDGFRAIYRDVALDEQYADGRLKELENLRVLNVGMFSQKHAGQPCEFTLRELHFADNSGELELKGNLYSLEDKPWFRLEDFNQYTANDEDFEFFDPETGVTFTLQSRWLQNYFGVDNAVQLEALLLNSDEPDAHELLMEARKEPVYSNLHAFGPLPPTYEEAEAWLQRNGHPHPVSSFVEIFIDGAPKDRQSQHWEAVANDYDLPDFDRWQHFQDILGTTCSWSCFSTCANALYEEDIDVMDIDISRAGEREYLSENNQAVSHESSLTQQILAANKQAAERSADKTTIFLFEENRSGNRMGKPGDANNIYYASWLNFYSFGSDLKPRSEGHSLNFKDPTTNKPVPGGNDISEVDVIEKFRETHPNQSVVMLSIESFKGSLEDKMTQAIQKFKEDGQALLNLAPLEGSTRQAGVIR